METDVAERRGCDEANTTAEGGSDLLLEDKEEEEEDEEETESNTELLERLRELEAENISLALANESQKEAYERCLDEVANHVVQALLNQKDLREECIKLKMRVFDLERQNRILTDILTHELHLSSTSVEQMCSVSSADQKSDGSITGAETPPSLTSEEKAKDESTSTPEVTGASAQASSSSMDVMSPFLKKKAQILEVLRKLEEEDPLKFHPSSCYHHHAQSILPSVMTRAASSSPCQYHCKHSISDSDLQEHAHANSEGSQPENRLSLNSGGCSACHILQQRSSLVLLKCNQGLGASNKPNPSSDCSQSSKMSSTEQHKDKKKSETLPAASGGKVRRSEQQEHRNLSQVCSQTFNKPSAHKKVSVGLYSSSSLPERSSSAFTNQQTKLNEGSTRGLSSPSCSISESTPSTSKLLELLRTPSANTPSTKSSSQLTRRSKIPCRNNLKPASPVRSRKSSTSEQPPCEANTSPPPHSTSTSPPNSTENLSFSSHLEPKTSKAFKEGAQVPHYENIEKPGDEKQEISCRDESPTSSDSSTSTSDSSSSSSDQETDTENQVLQRPQHHFSLPATATAAIKAQRISYPCVPDRYYLRVTPDLASSRKCGTSSRSQASSKESNEQALPKRPSNSSCHPFKERLVALGRSKTTEDPQRGLEKRGSNTSKTLMSSRTIVPDRLIHDRSSLKHSLGTYTKVPSFADRKHTTKSDGQKFRIGTPFATLCETRVVMRSNLKHPGSLTKTGQSPHASPTRGQSKSPSKTGNNYSYPRGTKPVQEERSHLQKNRSCADDKQKPAIEKKKSFSHADTLMGPLPSRSRVTSASFVQEKRPSASQSSIEQKVMRGIEENALKDRGQGAEAKHKGSIGIASWFGLKKSKLPALSRKSGKVDHSGSKDIPGAKAGSKKVVESLNISKLMEKTEDLRKALEDERIYMEGIEISLDRPARGHSCEVMMDPTHGQLSLMYAGMTSDGFMQQVLNRMEDGGATGLGIMHRRLSFDSKRSRPVLGPQQHGVRHTRSGEEMGKCLEMMRGEDVRSKETLAKSISSQHVKGSGSSMRTLDSGIGTFPLPDYGNNASVKLNPQLHSSSICQQVALKLPRKARTLDRELSALDELQAFPLEHKGTAVLQSSTIHEDLDNYETHPTTNWTRDPEQRSRESPSKPSLDRVPAAPQDVEHKNVPPPGSRKARTRNRRAAEPLKDGGLDLIKEGNGELVSPSRPQASETPESLSDSLYDSLSSCGSQG